MLQIYFAIISDKALPANKVCGMYEETDEKIKA